MAIQPEILYKNILSIAQAGRGCGTIFATATAAAVSQANKTFTLTGLSIITDLGADADDKFNGYYLYFTTSENWYLITDWTATGDVATVYEYPSASDTGACEIRRKGIYTPDFDAAYPVRNICNGFLDEKWKHHTANDTAYLYVSLPNGVDDGTFESGGLTHWTTSIDGDGSISINSSSPLVNTYDCLINMGSTATAGSIAQAGKIDLEAGETYGIKCRFRNSGTGTEGDELTVSLRYASGASTYIKATFTLAGNGSLTSLGAGTNNAWIASVPDSAWTASVLFTVPAGLAAGEWEIHFEWTETDARDDLYIDVISVTPAFYPDTFSAFGHNFAGGFTSSSINGLAWYDNTGGTIFDIDANVSPDGEEPIFETFTASTVTYPIYKITLWNATGKTWEAAELWLGARWTWPKFISGTWNNNSADETVNVVTSSSGVEVLEERYTKRGERGQLRRLAYAEKDKWVAFTNEVKTVKPFIFKLPAITEINHAEEILFMRNKTRPTINLSGVKYTADYQFQEVL